jgi:CRP-like cAMP-binding protein
VSREAVIVGQGAEDNDVFLILAGTFMVLVNGKKIATRVPNDHVGEMAAIQQSQRRSATVVATEPAVIVKLNGTCRWRIFNLGLKTRMRASGTINGCAMPSFLFSPRFSLRFAERKGLWRRSVRC